MHHTYCPATSNTRNNIVYKTTNGMGTIMTTTSKLTKDKASSY